MTALSIQPTYPIFTDIDGQPLEDGYVWIGVANLAPIVNPITVYWDAALTIPAAQPIRTRGGYPVNSGTPARLYVNSDYSIQVQNKNGSVVYSAPAATERYGNIITPSTINFSHATTYPQGTVGNALQLTINVKNAPFNAVGDGVADDTAAIQAAFDFVNSKGGGEVFLPAGNYLSGQLTLRDKVSIRGVGNATRFVAKPGAFDFFYSNGPAITNLKISDFYVDLTAQTSAFSGMYITGIQDSEVSGVTIYNAAGFGWLIFASVRCKYLRNTINTTRKWDGMTITTGSVDNVIEGNIVYNSYDSGIGFTDTLGTTCVGNHVKRQKIAGNWFAPGIDAAGAKNAVITGNYVFGNLFGVSVLQHPNSGSQPKRVTVTGNTIADGTYGVISGPVVVIPPAVSEPTTRDGIVISGNTIFNQDVQGIAVVGAECVGVAITGNQISYCGTAIGLNLTVATTVVSNLIFDNGDGINTFGSSNVDLNMAFNVFESNTSNIVGSYGTGTPYILHNKGLASPLATLSHEAFTPNWDFPGQLQVGTIRFWQNGNTLYYKNGIPVSAFDGTPVISVFASNWDFANKLQLGNYYLWVDVTGDLRIKNGAPTSDLDGVVVGTQT